MRTQWAGAMAHKLQGGVLLKLGQLEASTLPSLRLPTTRLTVLPLALGGACEKCEKHCGLSQRWGE